MTEILGPDACEACEGTGVGNGNKMGGICRKCGGTGEKKVAPASQPKETSARSPKFFRGARIR